MKPFIKSSHQGGFILFQTHDFTTQDKKAIILSPQSIHIHTSFIPPLHLSPFWISQPSLISLFPPPLPLEEKEKYQEQTNNPIPLDPTPPLSNPPHFPPSNFPLSSFLILLLIFVILLLILVILLFRQRKHRM